MMEDGASAKTPAKLVVHFLRHGEVFNPDKVFYGCMPGFHLSEKGFREAREVGKVLADTCSEVSVCCGVSRISALMHSPLLRARETAEVVAASLPRYSELADHLEVEKDLVEVNVPYEGRPISELIDLNWELYNHGREQEGFETFSDVFKRVRRLVGRLMRSPRHAGTQVIAVCHGDLCLAARLWAKAGSTAVLSAGPLKGAVADGVPYPGHCSLTTIVLSSETDMEQPQLFDCPTVFNASKKRRVDTPAGSLPIAGDQGMHAQATSASKNTSSKAECKNGSQPPKEASSLNPLASFLGITSELSKEDQIRTKNRNIDVNGVYPNLPPEIQESLADASLGEFQYWFEDHPAAKEYPGSIASNKACAVRIFTKEECAAIIKCMKTSPDDVGVMGAEQTASLYPGRLNTARYLISDEKTAELVYNRIKQIKTADGKPLLPQMRYALKNPDTQLLMQGTGADVVSVGAKIRLVTTEFGGGQGIHADISEKSDDGRRVSVITFQCYLNPEDYEGGHFVWYPLIPSTGEAGSGIDIKMTYGSALLFCQEDAELQHGGGEKLSGNAKRAIRGNLEVLLRP